MSTFLAAGGIVDTITGLIGGLLYPAFSIIFLLIDIVQSVFYSFAGIGNAQFGEGIKGWGHFTPITNDNTGVEDETGLLYFLMNNSIVKNLLISIMVLALFLIIIFTVMAFIKNAYSAKPKGWKEIIGNAIKGLANFIFLPVCCLLGVWLGNILLQAINGATSTTESASMSRKLFVASAYNANSFRNYDLEATADEDLVERLEGLKNGSWKDITYLETGEKFDWSVFDKCKTNGEYADAVDEMHAQTNINIYLWGSVEHMYSLFEVNYLVMVVGGVFMLYVLGSLAFAMVRRIFILLTLFVISPGVCALYPLDEGKAVGSWAGEVKKQILSAYGAVAGVNIFFSLIPLIGKISVSSGGWGFGTDDIVQIFIFVVGLLCVKELIGLISGFVGGEDAYGKGASMFSSARGAIKKWGGGTAQKVTGYFAKAKGNYDAKGGGVKAFFSSFLGQPLKGAGNTLTKEVLGLDFKELNKTRKDAYKGAKEESRGSKYEKDFKKTEAYNNVTKEGKDLAKFMKDASYYGVDDAKAYEMLQKKLKDSGNEMTLPEIKIKIAEYNKQQEDEKMRRMAAYNAKGKEYEKDIEDAVANVKTADVNIQSAKTALKTAQTSAGYTKWQTEVKKAIKLAENNSDRGGKKGDKQQAREKAVKEMRRIVDSKETTSTLDPSKFSGAFKDAVADFNKQLSTAASSIQAVATASTNLKTAQDAYSDSITQIKSTVAGMTTEFSTVQSILDEFGTTTEKTVADVEKFAQQVKNDIRGTGTKKD